MLEKIGNTKESRRVAFGYIMGLLRKSGGNRNLILLFRNREVLFSGSSLSYKISKEGVGVMTFGLPNKCDDTLIYRIHKDKIFKYKPQSPPFAFERKPVVAKPDRQRNINQYYEYADLQKWGWRS
jgi:hypothetical protein